MVRPTSSRRVIVALPDPVAPPGRPVAVRVASPPVDDEAGMLTMTCSWMVSASFIAVSFTMAAVADPPELPVKVTVPPESATPVGLPLRARVKSVPGSPPVNSRGITRLSPVASARGSASLISAALFAFHSCASVSGAVNVTASGSVTVTATESILMLVG